MRWSLVGFQFPSLTLGKLINVQIIENMGLANCSDFSIRRYELFGQLNTKFTEFLRVLNESEVLSTVPGS